ncbi:MAG: hypothetical protein ACTTKL_05710 [Treponema sp.]
MTAETLLFAVGIVAAFVDCVITVKSFIVSLSGTGFRHVVYERGLDKLPRFLSANEPQNGRE